MNGMYGSKSCKLRLLLLLFMKKDVMFRFYGSNMVLSSVKIDLKH